MLKEESSVTWLKDETSKQTHTHTARSQSHFVKQDIGRTPA